MKKEIRKILEKTVKELQGERIISEIQEIKVEYPPDENYGDYSTNLALLMAKKLNKSPLKLAEDIKSEILKSKKNFLEKIEIKNPGFINFFISRKYLFRKIKEILDKKEKFSELNIGKNKKINIEFISANPTGPLTLGNGRGGFCGDVLANIFKKAGYRVIKEYYINDVGVQIKKLGYSVIGGFEAVYKGDYIEKLKKRIKENNPEKAGEKAAKIILDEMIKPSIKKMGIKFDVFFSEKSLYKKGLVDKIIKLLEKKGFIYKKDNAIWFKSTQFGDDKDRVLVRADGVKTYFASDVAYLKNKFDRGFKKLIMFLGADHYGYVRRLKAVSEALGYKKERIDIIVMQLVRLFESGKEKRMSKREGIYVTIDELINDVGLDAARFFFLLKSPDTHLNFDLDLAKRKSKENPVYYVQYAYARICSIISKLEKNKTIKKQINISDLELLNDTLELNLLKQLIKLPDIIEEILEDYQIQRLPQYAISVSDAFHKFYENCRVISEKEQLTKARLILIMATKIVLKDVFDLMGISAPERM